MNAEYMMVDPNELVIDLPVDDAHVQELMDSLQRTGRMLEPITVWLRNMRIANGFHRTTAAQRLGWKEVPCMVFDYTEDEFWDARIIAAKPHKAIEPARLALWMLESWKQTPWCIAGKEYDSMLSQVWEVIKKRNLGYKIRPLKEEQKPILDWFSEKAKRWGISEYEIADKIRGIPYVDRRADLVHDLDLSIEKARIIALAPDRGYHEEIDEWARTEVAAKDTPLLFRPWLDEKRKQDREREQAWAARHEAFLDTPAGKAQAEKERLQRCRERVTNAISYAEGNINSTAEWLTSVPDAPAMLAEFAQFVIDFANEHFPGIEIAKPNPVSLDNARLRAENSKLREQIRSLERALGSKQAAGEMLSSAMAWSSGDLESR